MTPDRKRADALRKMARSTLERLDTTNRMRYASQTVKEYYEILHMLLEAVACDEGRSFKGEGAHRDLIDYIAHTESDRAFLQQLRRYRNRISYEGFTIPREYLTRNEARIRMLIRVFL